MQEEVGKAHIIVKNEMKDIDNPVIKRIAEEGIVRGGEQIQKLHPSVYKAAGQAKIEGISRRGVLKGKEPNPLRVRHLYTPAVCRNSSSSSSPTLPILTLKQKRQEDFFTTNVCSKVG